MQVTANLNSIDIYERYSNEEIVIGSFLGKTLYRRTAKLNKTGNDVTWTYSDVDTYITHMYGILQSSSNACIDLHHENRLNLYTESDRKTVHVYGQENGILVLTVEYTKEPY